MSEKSMAEMGKQTGGYQPGAGLAVLAYTRSGPVALTTPTMHALKDTDLKGKAVSCSPLCLLCQHLNEEHSLLIYSRRSG